MTPAQYMLIRYIADPIRNEALNVGIVVWNQSNFRFGFDPEAARRVIQYNPHLETDALIQVEAHLRHLLSSPDSFDMAHLLNTLTSENRFPLELTEPRLTHVPSGVQIALDTTYERLISNLVRPRRRRTTSHAAATQVFAQRFQPLLKQHLMTRDHTFTTSRTGIQRRVDFYANSGTNLALDAVRLRYRDRDRIIEAADHEAFKIQDIAASNKGVRWIVYCDFSRDETLAEANANARRILSSTGAEIDEEIDGVTRKVMATVSPFHA